jgi:acetoin utilization protein AcuB
MEISRWMSTKPVTIGPRETLADARREMDEGGFRRLPVLEQGKLIGIITDRDLRQHLGQLEHTRVDAVMAKQVITATPHMLLDEAANLMVKHKIGGLPVMDNGKLVGIITAIDMLRAFGQVLGTTEEGVSRIDLTFDGSSFDLAMIAQLVGLSSGEVLGMGTYDGGNSGGRIFYVRIRSEDVRSITEMLTDNGFNVVAVHP